MLDKNMDQWTELDFLRKAYIYARDASTDPSTQCGAVLVPRGHGGTIATFGANHFPRGVECTPEMLADRDVKLFRMQHAERAAICKAALNGFATNDATMYAPWYACNECAKDIIDCGIKRVVGHQSIMDKTPERWAVSIGHANLMLDEAGVSRVYLEGDLFDSDPAYAVLFNGKLWVP
jgi:dCMP deaminase